MRLKKIYSTRTCRRLLTVKFGFILVLLLCSCTAPYPKPPKDLMKDDLLGIWEAHYSLRAVDQLVLRRDDFSQKYQDKDEAGYNFEQSGNEWTMKHFPDGRVQIWLERGKYFRLGYNLSKKLPIYNPFTEEFEDVATQLILEVRTDSAGNLILHHLFLDADQGFALIGGERQYFRKVDPP